MIDLRNIQATVSPNRVRRKPWLWLNLLSLDAPLVAVSWQVLWARSFGVSLRPVEPLILALVVWCIYSADQMLDVSAYRPSELAPERKRFYRKHLRRAARLLFAAVIATLAASVIALPPAVLRAGLLLLLPVLGYFALVHLLPCEWRSRWPREAVVALIFSLGTSLIAYIGREHHLSSFTACLWLLALLCWWNVSAIETWEWQISIEGRREAPSASARWITQHLKAMAACTCCLALLMAVGSLAPLSFALAICASGAALILLDGLRPRLSVSAAHVAADAVLCMPLLFLALAWVK